MKSSTDGECIDQFIVGVAYLTFASVSQAMFVHTSNNIISYTPGRGKIVARNVNK